jgi:subtilisin family serine protease
MASILGAYCGRFLSSLAAKIAAICGVACILAAVMPSGAWAQIFGPDQRLTFAPWGSQTGLTNAWSVAVDSRRNVHVVYFDGRAQAPPPPDTDLAIYYSRHDLSLGAWQPEVRLPDHDPACAQFAALAADGLDRIHVVWYEERFDVPYCGPTLFYKQADSTGAWLPEATLSTANPVGQPCIAADLEGNAFAVWTQSNAPEPGGLATSWNVFLCERAAFGGWGPPTQLTVMGVGQEAVDPTIACEIYLPGTTVLHVAWYQDLDVSDGIPGWIRYATYSWEAGVLSVLDNTQLLPTTTQGRPCIAARCGRVHIAWTVGPEPGTLVHRTAVMPADSLGPPTFAPAAPTGVAGSNPNIAIDGNGDVHAVLLQDPGAPTGGTLVAVTWDATLELWGPVRVISDPGAVFAGNPSLAIDARHDHHVVWTDVRVDPDTLRNYEVYYDGGACRTVPNAAARPMAKPASGEPARLDASLQAALAAARPDASIPVLIHVRDRADIPRLVARVQNLPKAERRRLVLDELQSHAERAHRGILAALTAGGAERVRSLWSIGAVSADVPASLIGQLALRDDVSRIVHDPPRRVLNERVGARSRKHEAAARPGAGEPRTRVRAMEIPWNLNWVGAPAVWAQGYRGDCVLVAVLDTGVDLGHTDLVDRLWRNPGEVPGNGIDDDANGYVDDFNGYDFYNGPAGAPDADPSDADGHGTHVAGTILGDGTGGTSTGVAPEAKVMALKVIGDAGDGTLAAWVQAMQYAVANGAQVLNMSIGMNCLPQVLRDDLRTAANVVSLAGAAVCAAVGNEGQIYWPPNAASSPGDVPPPWISPAQPGLGSQSGVISVGATRYMANAVTTFSSRGPVDWSRSAAFGGDWSLADMFDPCIGLIKPDVCAPGERIKSLLLGGGYVGDAPSGPGRWDGTSMATPHVTGIVALMLSKNPGLLPLDVQQILELTAMPLGPPKNNRGGSGGVRAPNAIALTPDPEAQTLFLVGRSIDDAVGGNGDGDLDPGESAGIVVRILNSGSRLARHVIGILAESDPYITITDDISALGDIPPSDIGTNETNAFRVAVDVNAPVGHIVDFGLSVSGQGACAFFGFQEVIGASGNVVGACCLDSSVCQVMTLSACANLCGSFQGAGSACATDSCTAFRVTGSDPAPWETGVSQTPTILVTFSEPAGAGEFNASTLRVRGAISGLAPGLMTLSPDGLTGTFVPDYGMGRVFGAGERVAGTVTRSLRSSQGAPLSRPYSWSFRTQSRRGTGAFAAPRLLAPDLVQVEVASGDMNRDGRADIVTLVNGAVDVIVYRNTTGLGDSLSYASFPFDVPGRYNLRSLILFDPDNDGSLDVAASASVDLGQPVIVVGRNAGDGSSFTWTDWPAVSNAIPEALVDGDFDGDGNPDVAFAADWHKIFVHYGDGAGGVRETVSSSGFPGAYFLAAQDVDRDGLLDLVVVQSTDPGRVTVLRNMDPTGDDDAVFAASSIVPLTWPRSPVVEDFTGDGLPDVAVTTTDQGVAVMPMQPCGVLGSPVYYPGSGCPPSSVLRSLAAIDFDGDGDMDLLSTYESCAAWAILENDGDGVFAWRSPVAGQWAANEAVAADLNADGVADVATTLRPVEVFLGVRDPVGVEDQASSGRPALFRAWPNPFTGRIRIQVPGTGPIRVEVFDVAGRLVWRSEDEGASSSLGWNGRDRAGREVPAGVYTLRARRNGRWESAKILRVR